MRNLTPAEIDRATNEIRLLGYAVIPNVLSSDLIDRLTALVERDQKTGAGQGTTSNQSADKYVYHLQYRDRLFLDILTDWRGGLDMLKPFLNDPFYRQLPPDDANFLLAYYNARSSVAALPLHIDNYVPTLGEYPNSMQLVFSLNGQGTHNGATIVVPGSHRAGQLPDRSLTDCAIPLECAPGDVIAWDSRLWHGALENVSGADRWSLVATFRPWFLKQNYDPVRGMPEEIYMDLTPQQKALCGFLSRPARDEDEKVSLKEGYDGLKETVAAYRQEN